MEEMVCTVHDEGGATVVRVIEKKLYQNTVVPFQKRMVSLIDAGKKKLVVNLSEVEVMNSSGLGVLILTWDRLSKEGGRLVIAGLCPMMEELFQRMRLDLLFTLAGTEDEALRLIGADKKIPAK
jgi:anti-sigma B factor antagonist